MEFFGRDPGDFAAEQRGHDLFRRSIEKGFNEMAKRGAAGDVARDSRGVDVAEAVLFVAHVPFFFEDAEWRTNGRITGLAGELSEDLADRGAFEPVEDVHNLAFAAGQGVCFGFSFHMLFF